ncbi:MAG: hypothetical protein L6Q57_07275 [Alphaproteobacteria bacterium]|nr:hypothetical protein [Alphaproteobacteria bacterium]
MKKSLLRMGLFFGFVACAFVFYTPAYAKSCEKNTTKACVSSTVGNFKCWTCYSKDTSTNKEYSGKGCRLSSATTPTDEQLQTTASDNSLANCNKNAFTYGSSDMGTSQSNTTKSQR